MINPWNLVTLRPKCDGLPLAPMGRTGQRAGYGPFIAAGTACAVLGGKNGQF